MGRIQQFSDYQNQGTHDFPVDDINSENAVVESCPPPTTPRAFAEAVDNCPTLVPDVATPNLQPLEHTKQEVRYLCYQTFPKDRVTQPNTK